jgi:hypothetical protein
MAHGGCGYNYSPVGNCANFAGSKEQENNVTEQVSTLYNFFRGRGFVPVGRESYPEFQNTRHDSVLLDLSATLINTWGFALNSVYKNIYGYLCVAWFCDGSPFHGGVPVYFTVLRPSGNPAYPLKEIIDILYGLAREAGLPFLPLESVEESFLEGYRGIEGYETKTEYSDDHSEYVYRVENLLELKGEKNFYKRKRIKKCLDMSDILVTPMTNENVKTCLEIQNEWCREQDCNYCGSFAGCEKKALNVMVDIFDEKVYTGLFLYHEKKPSGYIICEKINERVAFLYFGKATISNFFVYLIYLMFKDHLTGVQYMNMSEDMGNMGLRQFKQHLSVYELWRKYLCVFSEI